MANSHNAQLLARRQVEDSQRAKRRAAQQARNAERIEQNLQAEKAQQAERARQAELDRQVERTRQAELDRQAERTRRAEEQRRRDEATRIARANEEAARLAREIARKREAEKARRLAERQAETCERACPAGSAVDFVRGEIHNGQCKIETTCYTLKQ